MAARWATCLSPVVILPATTYVLDPSDRIVAVDEAWIAFAEANDAGALAHRVLGQSLWSFIANVTVREIYRTLLSRVRETKHPVALPFRCDSAAVRRFMTLSVGPDAGPPGTLICRAIPVREEPQPAEARALYAAIQTEPPFAGPATTVGEQVMTMCSSCKRLDVGGWCEIADAVQRDANLLTEPVRPISHGLCPACRDRMLAAVA